jgi:adenylylsulfate kinase-like enzyme
MYPPQPLPKIIYTVGPARCGKTTFANWLLFNRSVIPTDNTLGLVYVDEDNIRLAMTGKPYVDWAERSVRATKHIMLKTLVSQGYSVIVADTHTRRESIDPILEIDNNALAVYIQYDIEDCINRAADHYEFKQAIRRMGRNLKERPHTGIRCMDAYQAIDGNFVCSPQYRR